MGRIARPAGENKPAMRERLLSAALELFTSKGYAATSVREIVASANVTKPVLYYYFGNKEGIYLELMQGPFQHVDAMLEECRRNTGSCADRCKSLCDRTLQLFIENLQTARLMYSIYYGPPQGAPFFDFDGYHDKLHDVTRELIEEGIASGEFRDVPVADMTWVILGVLTVAMEEQLCRAEPRFDQEGLARVLDLILAGFAPQKREGVCA